MNILAVIEENLRRRAENLRLRIELANYKNYRADNEYSRLKEIEDLQSFVDKLGKVE